MGKTILYKIPLPFTVEDYIRANLYTTSEVTRRETGNGSGIEVLENVSQPFQLPDGSETTATYTHKIYHMERMTPSFIRTFANKCYGQDILKFVENSWNCYPYMYTSSVNKEKSDRFKCTLISTHLQDKGDNPAPPHLVSNPFLKEIGKGYDSVQVKYLDITQKFENEPNFKYDPTTFRSEAMQVGPLPESTERAGHWWDNYDGPVMCAYKFCHININFFPLSSQMEYSFLRNQEVAMLRMHKQMFCFLDEWGPMSMENVRAFEISIGKMTKDLLLKEDVVFEYNAAEEGEKKKLTPSTNPSIDPSASRPVSPCASGALSTCASGLLSTGANLGIDVAGAEGNSMDSDSRPFVATPSPS